MKISAYLSALKYKLKLHRLHLPSSLFFLLKIYLIGIAVLTVFRFVLLIVEQDRLPDNGDTAWLVFQALFMGWRFDTVISGYILALPVLLCLAGDLLHRRVLIKAAGWLSAGLYTAVFLIGVADIPYFSYNFSRLNTSAFLWADSPLFVVTMLMQSPLYLFYCLLFLLIAAAYFYVIRKVIAGAMNGHKHHKYRKANLLIFYPVFCFLIFTAIRGRLDEKSPIRTGTAYFSDNPFINQLGLNPAFTLIRSIADDLNPDFSAVNLVEPGLAIKTAALELSAQISKDHKLVRTIVPVYPPEKRNVIVILMESMSAIYLKNGGAEQNFAPFLDSLAGQSIYFENFFSAGLHTFNGVYSSLYSLPALFRQHPLKSLKSRPARGLPQVLKENGYRNYFFMTHDDQFDNMGGYLRNNGFDRVFSKNDYPGEELVSTLGIPDDKLYQQVIAKLDSQHDERPFFCTILTVSNHPPYYTPDYFHSPLTAEKERGAAFADWSLRQFFARAAKEDWYYNTIFLILGDHGTNQPDNYELPLAFCHIPLLIYSPDQSCSPQKKSAPGGQIDLFPTVMGLLKIPYENEGLGVDLLKDRRSYIYINGDDKTAVVADSLFYIFKAKGADSVYDLRTGKIADSQAKADSLKQIVFSLLQAAQGIIR